MQQLSSTLLLISALGACGGDPGGGDTVDAAAVDGSQQVDAAIDAASVDTITDDFERPTLGPNWMVVYPPPPNTQVQVVGGDVGMGPGPEGFFLLNRVMPAFAADQFCDATIPTDATPGWIYQVYVRWRASDRARYGFGYNGDPNQASTGNWIFKYDGVPSAQTRVFAMAPAAGIPQPGDRIRLEIVGFTLRGYWNGALVLQATDTDASRIASGVPGLAARWATGNQQTTISAKVWEAWSGGSL